MKKSDKDTWKHIDQSHKRGWCLEKEDGMEKEKKRKEKGVKWDKFSVKKKRIFNFIHNNKKFIF